MKKLNVILIVLFGLALSFWSCQQSQMPVENDFEFNSNELLKPPVLVSAVLKINVEDIAGNTAEYENYDLTIQKISTSWDEMTATWESPWTNAGGDYFVTPAVSHQINSSFPFPGIMELDITPLWTDGVPPLGIILRVENPAEDDKRIKFRSREVGAGAEVVVTYSKKNKTITDTYQVIEDTWISNRGDWSNDNFGGLGYLYAGNIQGDPNKEKRTLLKFEVPSACETAYGYNSEYSTCFIDDGFGNWGWTNGELDVGTYVLDLYAGAGQCDTEKGTYVGTASVDFDGSSATITYNLDAGFTMSEAHVYAGSEPYPLDKKGNPTVAPGKYTVVVDDLGGVGTHEVTIDGLSGNIYVIVHAVVCGQYDTL